MAIQSRLNQTNYSFIKSGVSLVREGLTFLQDASRTAVLALYTVLGQVAVTVPIVGTEDEGNTGTGTCTGVALIAGILPRTGTFELECTAIGTDAATGTAALTGTGNGTVSAVTLGSEAIVGAYIATCTDATVSGSEIFEVVTPDGVLLESLTVGAAYLNDHIGLTITDGSTDFIVGSVCTVTVVAADGGTFKLTDPGGNIVAMDLVMAGGAGVATTFYVPRVGLTFILTDATDFAVADVFTIAVASSGKYVPFDPDAVNGSQIVRGVLIGGDDITAAALVAGDVTGRMVLVGGCCTVDSDLLVFENSATLASGLAGGGTLQDALDALGIYAEDTIAVDEFENA